MVDAAQSFSLVSVTLTYHVVAIIPGSHMSFVFSLKEVDMPIGYARNLNYILVCSASLYIAHEG